MNKHTHVYRSREQQESVEQLVFLLLRYARRRDQVLSWETLELAIARYCAVVDAPATPETEWYDYNG